MMKKIILFSFILFMSFLSVLGQTNKYNLDDLIHFAKESSPSLAAVKFQIKADESRIKINSNLPDPLISFGVTNLPINSFSFTQEPMTGKMISVTQAIPFPGKLSTIKELNEFDKTISTNQYRENENNISLLMKRLYFQLYYSKKEYEVIQNKKELFSALAEVLNSRFQNSLTSQKDVIMNDYQISVAEDKLIAINSDQQNILSNISVLTEKEIKISEIDFSEINQLEKLDLTNLSLEANPSINKLKSMINKSAKKIELTDYNYYPDFKFTVQYNQRDIISKTNTNLNDFISFIVGFNLPINFGGRIDAATEESEYTQKYFEQNENAVRQDLSIKLQTAEENYKSLKKRLALINNELIEKAELNYKTTLSAYQTDKASFNDVVASINFLFDEKLKRDKIITELNKTISEIIYLTGYEFKEIYQ